MSNNLYTKAEQIIEKTKLSESTKIDLSDLQLTELPASMQQLYFLQEINLSKNQLTQLPDFISKFKYLRHIKVSINQIEAIPNWIGQLAQLQELNFNSNKIKKIPETIGQLTQLRSLYLSDNHLTDLPEKIGQLKNLQYLELINNQLTELPPQIGQLNKLQQIDLTNNKLTYLPEEFGQLIQLQHLFIPHNRLTKLPESIGLLSQLEQLLIYNNNLVELPDSLINLKKLREFILSDNKLIDLPTSFVNMREDLLFSVIKDTSGSRFLNLEIQAAYQQGIDSVKTYLRAKAAEQITLNEAKLILIGEGEVGKTCLMDALLDREWQDHPSTHGIEIRQVNLLDTVSQKEIILNGWDFGGQRVYRPTHQLFFSAPAIYLVVWKPREGSQQGFVKEWIQLVIRREPKAKIIVVATHGGPQQRLPDIDRQELWDLFGRDTILDFFSIDSKPDSQGQRKGVIELKKAIARAAADLPEVGRSVPKSFQGVNEELKKLDVPYLSLNNMLDICYKHNMENDVARLFLAISHRLGHLTHYENDPTLHDIIVLRPDWLATAISYVLDDDETRQAHGLVKFSHLRKLWGNTSSTSKGLHYPAILHPIFIRLMERFDLSYKVVDPMSKDQSDSLNLVAQLVPDIRPENVENAWALSPSPGDIQQTQICHIVDSQNGQSANAEGMFYQLIVRLHRYSLGNQNYKDSIHWKRGLILDGDYNGKAILRHIGNDIHITVRAPYPERFLGMLTEEVKYLIESFWEGLRCDVTVPCLNPNSCAGLFEVEKLIENKGRGRLDQPCPVCNEWQIIDHLLRNAPAASPPPLEEISNEAVLKKIIELRIALSNQSDAVMGRFDNLESSQRELLSKADASFYNLMKVFADEAKDGPRLFSMFPVDTQWLELPKKMVNKKFRILLWCEHSQLPLYVLNEEGNNQGVYDVELPHKWIVKAAPYLKALTTTLSLILPLAAVTTKIFTNEEKYNAIENQLAYGQKVFTSLAKESKKTTDWVNKKDFPDLPHGVMQRAEDSILRELHSFLKAKDPGFGGLVRVMNKRQEFLWVHEKYASEY